jgi:hypothetical protein
MVKHLINLIKTVLELVNIYNSERSRRILNISMLDISTALNMTLQITF